MSSYTPPQTALSTDQAMEQLERLHGAEQHFDEMKSNCRTLASTWLLATFGAMGFSLTQTFTVPLPTEVVVLALGVAGAVGIFLLWILDLLVYHRLLDASFSEALRLEAAFPMLPQVRHAMMASQPGGQTPYWERWFYIGALAAPVLMAGALFVRWLAARHGGPAALLAALLLLGALGATAMLMRRMSPNPALANRLTCA